jgi:hypothetical protein
MEWQIGEKFTVDAAGRTTTAISFRSTNTYLFNPCSIRASRSISSHGDGVIKVSPSQDLNNTKLLDLERVAHPARAA